MRLGEILSEFDYFYSRIILFLLLVPLIILGALLAPVAERADRIAGLQKHWNAVAAEEAELVETRDDLEWLTRVKRELDQDWTVDTDWTRTLVKVFRLSKPGVHVGKLEWWQEMAAPELGRSRLYAPVITVKGQVAGHVIGEQPDEVALNYHHRLEEAKDFTTMFPEAQFKGIQRTGKEPVGADTKSVFAMQLTGPRRVLTIEGWRTP